MPVAHYPRIAGQSKYGMWNRLGRGLYDLIGVRWFLKRQIKAGDQKSEVRGQRPDGSRK
jgi:hypothetical protein